MLSNAMFAINHHEIHINASLRKELTCIRLTIPAICSSSWNSTTMNLRLTHLLSLNDSKKKSQGNLTEKFIYNSDGLVK